MWSKNTDFWLPAWTRGGKTTLTEHMFSSMQKKKMDKTAEWRMSTATLYSIVFYVSDSRKALGFILGSGPS